MNPEEMKAAFEECETMIREKVRLSDLCVQGKKVKLVEALSVFVDNAKVVKGWVVGYEVKGPLPITRASGKQIILHVKPEVHHDPTMRSLHLRAEDLLAEDPEVLLPKRFPANKDTDRQLDILQHALAVCLDGKRLAEAGQFEEAREALGFVRGVMWVALGLALEDVGEGP